MKTEASAPPRRAFTLVELLAVIAIIGVLAAIILPVLGSVRSKATAVRCSGQVRQLGVALQMYLQEHKGIMPPTDNAAWKFENHTAQGIRMLRQYYRPGPAFVWKPDGTFIRDETDICPSVAQNGLTTNPVNGGPDYGMASQATGKNAHTHYEQPSRTPVIWDSWNAAWTNDSGAKKTLPLRHSGALNCVFLDGHVERIKGSDKRLWSGWWYSAAVNSRPNDAWLGSGWALGSTIIP
ncbi:N-terminal cleavage protein [Opitutaceae bacterium TAV5]|nr:N-terminal cleavage protein [Opitutaceae bacterium TAV5]